MPLGAALDNCLCFSFARRVSYRRGFSAVYKITKFGGFPNLQSAHAVFRLGKPSLKRKIYYNE